jgi:hypothetical protein
MPGVSEVFQIGGFKELPVPQYYGVNGQKKIE